MNNPSDQQLLQDYAANHSNAAFAELVLRHVDLVYSAALRMTRNSSSAQDVTQEVFLALARNASSLSKHPVVSGWLHRTARNVAANAVRASIRRKNHEQEAAVINELLADAPDASWKQIAPQLDDALGELSDTDRDAVLLRYFERKSAQEMAQALGISAEAAQKRVCRAVERLGGLLRRRGLTATSAALCASIAAHGVQAAPAGLIPAISNAAAAVSAVQTSAQLFAMTTIQKTALGITLTLVIGAGLHQAHQSVLLKASLEEARRNSGVLTETNAKLTRQRDGIAQEVAALQEENAHLRRNTEELLRLRGEIATIRSSAPPVIAADPAEITLKAWAHRVKEFQQLQFRMPDRTIPELKLLTQEDWLDLAKEPLGHDPDEVHLDDESTARLVLSACRAKAKDKLAPKLSKALDKYVAANGGVLPTDPIQLQPYLTTSVFIEPGRVEDATEPLVDDSVLRRYAVLQTGRFEDVPKDAVIIAEKSPVDTEYDSRAKIGKYWVQIDNGPEAYVSPAQSVP